MIMQPIVPLVFIVVIATIGIGFTAWQYIVSKARHQRIQWARRASIIGLIALMSVGFSIPGGQSPSGMLNLDVIFLVDTTTSMGAEDYAGTGQRLEGARQDIIKISDKMAGARFSIISFDSAVKVALPMTSDRSTLQLVASSLPREGSTYTKGSSIDLGVDAAVKQLVSDKKANPQRPNVVFYFGDGEQTIKAAPKSFAALQPFLKSGAVLGYGTTQGGKMKQYYGYGDDTKCQENSFSSCYVVDPSSFDSLINNVPGISKMSEINLKKIASDMGVSYINRNDGGPVDGLFNTVNIVKLADTSRQVTFYVNLYYIFAIPLLGLVVWELVYLVAKLREHRKAKPGVSKVSGATS